MLFPVVSKIPFSIADDGLSSDNLTTSTGILGGITLGFGFKYAGTSGATSIPYSTASTSTTTTVTTTTTTTTTTISGFNFNPQPLFPPRMGNIDPFGVSSASSTWTVNSIVTPVMTYTKLEDLINKWKLEPEDHEKYFLRQVAHINAWDRTLLENGDKIITLHGEVERVKMEQQRLEQELNFILSHQNELENLSIRLEGSVNEQSGAAYMRYADEERERTLKLAENIDAQLKQMAQDLKDIIAYLNTFQSPAETTDPLQQVCKILNAHMDCLHQIDHTSGLLQRKVEEVAQIFEYYHLKEQENTAKIDFE